MLFNFFKIANKVITVPEPEFNMHNPGFAAYYVDFALRAKKEKVYVECSLKNLDTPLVSGAYVLGLILAESLGGGYFTLIDPPPRYNLQISRIYARSNGPELLQFFNNNVIPTNHIKI